jgi:hypothetical protein
MVQPFGASWWNGVAEDVVRLTKDLAGDGQGALGPWPGYSAKYAARKATGTITRQSSSQVSPPNLELTGDLLKDLKVIETRESGATVGFPSKGDVAWGNEERGRAIFSDAGPAPSVARQIDKAARRMFETQIDRTRGTSVIRIGK